MTQKIDLSPYYNQTPVEQFWGEIRLTKGFTALPKLDLSKAPLVDILTYLGKDLSFLNHVRVVKTIKELIEDFDTDEYFNSVGFSNTSYLIKALEVVASMPKSFINWATEKSLSPKDFRIFFGVEMNDDLQQFLESTIQTKPSKSEGLLILEYGIDLYYGKKLDDSFFKFKDSSKLLAALKRKRFLKTVEADEKIDLKISKINFGSDSKIKTLRNGDKRLLHIEIKSTHPSKLKKSLERISNNVEKIEDVWT